MKFITNKKTSTNPYPDLYKKFHDLQEKGTKVLISYYKTGKVDATYKYKIEKAYPRFVVCSCMASGSKVNVCLNYSDLIMPVRKESKHIEIDILD